MFGNMFDWIRRLFPRSSRPQRRRQAAQHRRFVRLHLEGLEERVVPATFNPTDAAGLQSAFAYADSNPSEQVIIDLTAGGAYNLGDIGAQLLDQNTAGITVNGNGSTITAATNNRVVEVDSGDKLTLNDLTVTGGNVTATTAQGGGIADFGGDLTLSGVNVTQNAVHGAFAAQGGGIYVSGSGTLTLQNGCQIDNNQAVGSGKISGHPGGLAYGGGIYVFSYSNVNVTIADSTLSNNSALGGANGTSGYGSIALGGGAYISGGYGGGCTIQSTSFSSNTAQGGDVDGGDSYAYGGDAYGGGLCCGVPLTLTASSFDNNEVMGGQGGADSSSFAGVAYGGGMSVGSATITNCSITNNTATGGSVEGSGLGGYAEGGGILTHGNPTLINTTLGGNTAQGGNAGAGGTAGFAEGGGLFALYGSTLFNDTIAFNAALAGSGGQTAATAQGGGVYGPDSTTLTNVILESNSAAAGPDFYGAVGTASGYDFISNTGGITNSTALGSMPGMILNNSTPQLGSLKFGLTTGLPYYPLLNNSQTIHAGTVSVVDAIAAAEGVSPGDATDEIGNPRAGVDDIDMGAVANLPIANDDSYSLLHDRTLNVSATTGVLANDTDPQNLPLSAVLVAGPSNGTFQLNGDGSFTYTPNAGYTGTDYFTYYASDGSANSNIAIVTIDVTDNAPVATDDTYTLPEDGSLTTSSSNGVLANDTDADGDALTPSLVSGPSHGTLTFNSDGTFTYIADAGFVGNDGFTYEDYDGAEDSDLDGENGELTFVKLVVNPPPSGDTLIWNPKVVDGVVSQDASKPSNWFDISQNAESLIAPDENNNLTVMLIGNYSATSNNAINWTQNANLDAMKISAGFNAGQILTNSTLTIDNDIQEDTNANTRISINVPNTNSSLVLAGGTQTWYNWAFAGDGVVHLSGGSVTVGGNYSMSTNAVIELDGGTMIYSSAANNQPIQLEDGGRIAVFSGGELDLNDNGFATTFIAGDGTAGERLSTTYTAVGSSNGFVYFSGTPWLTDIIAVPVWNAGNFDLNGNGGGGRGNGATLKVTGTDPALPNPNVSWYSSGDNNGYTSLIGGVTLLAAAGYDQENTAILYDGDTSIETLQAGDGSGTVTIGAGTKVRFFRDPESFGDLRINATTINFNGELDAYVNGATSWSSNQIWIGTNNATVNWGARSTIQLTPLNGWVPGAGWYGWVMKRWSWQVVTPWVGITDVTNAGAKPTVQAAPGYPLPSYFTSLGSGVKYWLALNNYVWSEGRVQVDIRREGGFSPL